MLAYSCYGLSALALLCVLSCNNSSRMQKEETPQVAMPRVDDNNFMMKMEKDSLKVPYRGITTSAGRREGLFPVHETGVTTEPIRTAADAFLKSLTKAQFEKTLYKLQDEEWRRWSNVDNGFYRRQGISIKEMTQEQRKLAYHLMKVSLSAKGYKLSKDIMKTDQTLREINDSNPMYDEELYFFTVMGEPSKREPWGWQIDGHHLVINYFVMGDQVVMTPTFMGGEPIITTSGKYKGNTLFQDEQNLGLQLMQQLPKEQQNKATISLEKTQNNNVGEAFKDNVIVDYQGLPVKEMSPENKERLLNLANQYIANMEDGHAKIKMEEVKDHLDETYFAWVGTTDDNAVFYYRIHSPVVLIEFDHQRPVGIPGDHEHATRNHIHTVVRTPNGNDYGKDLLQQHLHMHHHDEY